jgi:hypothetical protein
MKQKQQKKGGGLFTTTPATTAPEKNESSVLDFFNFLKSDKPATTAEPKVTTADQTLQNEKKEASGKPNSNSLFGGKKQRKSKKQNKSKKQRKSKSRKQ